MTDASQLVAPAVSPTKTRLAWKRRLIVFVAICGVSVVPAVGPIYDIFTPMDMAIVATSN